MRVSVIWSSANQDGLTACAKDAIINGAKRSGAVIESINLNHQELEHCRACGTGAICAEQRPLVRLPAATWRSPTATLVKVFR